ncbi:hypothetical protein H6P81_008112 [Aristolochia fimbriata]|uniref:OVATE domain-containing protein n=1 Tax=Aristolochia fimbriata TaxID=158543 RepID=A0AAV7F6N2_ARIFI|nr:hypothetical protein H6P81_008112 [Aristolochia fimbriata]
MQVPVALKAKPQINPWKKLRRVFKFKLRRPIFLKLSSFRFRKLRPRRSSETPETKISSSSSTPRKGSNIRRFFSIFRGRRSPPAEEMDQVGELRSLPEVGRGALFPSPITPANLKRARESTESSSSNVEDACRSFENYLAEMIVEEKRLKDLTDVEELLYCWRNLRSPVFHDLVCRFYRELCVDLFSRENEEKMAENSPTKYKP